MENQNIQIQISEYKEFIKKSIQLDMIIERLKDKDADKWNFDKTVRDILGIKESNHGN